MQISAKSQTSKFSFGKNYVKKNRVYFLALCANLTCKIEDFELEVVGVGILGIGFCFQGSH